MKYFVFVALIIISLLSFSKTPAHKLVDKDISFTRDAIVLKKVADSLPYKLGNRRVSKREFDSVINKVIEETFQYAKKMGYIETTKQQ